MAHIQKQYSELWKPEFLTDKIDQQKMFQDNIDQGEINYIKLASRIQNSVANITALRAINTLDANIFKDGTVISVKTIGANNSPSIYIYDTTSTLTDNGSSIIKPTYGNGRWINVHPYMTPDDIVGLQPRLDEKVNINDGDISETVIETLEVPETEFPVPSAGESTKGFMGKVRKFIQDFNAFKTGIITLGRLVNNGQTTEAGFALDARYGKTLYDLYAQLNANLNDLSIATFHCCKGIITQSIYFNGQTITATVAPGFDHIIAAVETGVAIGVLSCTCTNKANGHFYIVLSDPYSGTLNITFYIFG